MKPVHSIHSTTVHSQSSTTEQKKTNRLLIAGTAFAFALIAVPVIYSLYQSIVPKICDPSSDLNLATDQPKQNEGYCKKNVSDLKEIDGVSIWKIEEFAHKNGVFGKRSFTDKLIQDCNLVFKMGTTKEELANHLNTIFSTGIFNEKISYNPAIQEKSTIGMCSKTQSIKKGDGSNTIPFANCASWGSNIFDEGIPVRACFQRVENLQNKIHMDLSKKIIERIRKYGFFDGFDPVDVGALLTGHSKNSIKQAIGADTHRSEINQVLSDITVKPWEPS